MQNYQNILAQIFEAAVSGVNPYRLVTARLFCNEHGILSVSLNEKIMAIDLNRYNKIVVVGAGKATADMAKALEAILGKRITDGIIAVKKGYAQELSIIQQIESGHPYPDENSLLAAEKIFGLLEQCDKDSLIISLISGGGSSLLCRPAKDISLSDKQQTIRVLLGCGANINEINCIRKHISSIKGGHLTQTAYPGQVLNLILSDVIGDDLSSIASGLFVPDKTTFKDMADIFDKYNLWTKVPINVSEHLKSGLSGLIPETVKDNDKCLNNVTTVLIGNNSTALEQAQRKAESLGFNAILLTSHLCGEAHDAAEFLAVIARGIAKGAAYFSKPVCIISDGETTVTLRGNGIGGRNQELALEFLALIQTYYHELKNVYLLSAATDGGDGPTDAAGGFASDKVLKSVAEQKINIQSYLDNNDSYTCLKLCNALLMPGPSGTNVCDIQIMIIRQPGEQAGFSTNLR